MICLHPGDKRKSTIMTLEWGFKDRKVLGSEHCNRQRTAKTQKPKASGLMGTSYHQLCDSRRYKQKSNGRLKIEYGGLGFYMCVKTCKALLLLFLLLFYSSGSFRFTHAPAVCLFVCFCFILW
jgi:hypothetical protein